MRRQQQPTWRQMEQQQQRYFVRGCGCCGACILCPGSPIVWALDAGDEITADFECCCSPQSLGGWDSLNGTHRLINAKSTGGCDNHIGEEPNWYYPNGDPIVGVYSLDRPCTSCDYGDCDWISQHIRYGECWGGSTTIECDPTFPDVSRFCCAPAWRLRIADPNVIVYAMAQQTLSPPPETFAASFTIPLADFNCSGPNTLTLIGVAGSLEGHVTMPATITIEPE